MVISKIGTTNKKENNEVKIFYIVDSDFCFFGLYLLRFFLLHLLKNFSVKEKEVFFMNHKRCITQFSSSSHRWILAIL